MKKALKRKALFDMWKKVVGDNFTKKSKPYSMMGRTLVVACENPAVAHSSNESMLITAISLFLLPF